MHNEPPKPSGLKQGWLLLAREPAVGPIGGKHLVCAPQSVRWGAPSSGTKGSFRSPCWSVGRGPERALSRVAAWLPASAAGPAGEHPREQLGGSRTSFYGLASAAFSLTPVTLSGRSKSWRLARVGSAEAHSTFRWEKCQRTYGHVLKQSHHYSQMISCFLWYRNRPMTKHTASLDAVTFIMIRAGLSTAFVDSY